MEILRVENLTKIYAAAFSGCSSLTEVSLPDKMELLTEGVFSRCTSLTKIYIPESVDNMHSNIFKESPNVTIYGKADSWAEFYAENNEIPFVSE